MEKKSSLPDLMKSPDAKSFMQGAFSMLSNSATAITAATSVGTPTSVPTVIGTPKSAASSEKTPDDIPKEELMHLCMKMNKRMQVLEAKNQELTKKKGTLSNERNNLLELIKFLIPSMVYQEESDLDLNSIQEQWTKWDVDRNNERIMFEQKLATNEQLIVSLKSKYKKEIANLESQLQTLQSQLAVPSSTSRLSPTPTDSNSISSLEKTQSSELIDASPTTTVLTLQLEVEEMEVDPPLSPLTSPSPPTAPTLVPTPSLPPLSHVDSSSSKTETSSTIISPEIEKDREELEAQISTLQAELAQSRQSLSRSSSQEASLRSSLSSLDQALRAKSQQLEETSKAAERDRTQLEERVLYLQMQMNTLKGKEETREKDLNEWKSKVSALQLSLEEKELALQASKEATLALKGKLMELEPENQRLRERVSDLSRMASSSTLLKAEQDELLNNLRKDLRAALEGKDEAGRRTRELEEYRLKTEGQLLKLASLTEQVSSLQTALDESSSLSSRLRSVVQAADTKYAMKTAMLATCEAQIQALMAEKSEREKESQENGAKLNDVLERLKTLQSEMESDAEAGRARITQLEKEKEAQALSAEEEMERIQQKHEEALEQLKRDFAKKSSLARSLLSEREEEVRSLSSQVQALQAEVESGAPSERKILELAREQAKREGALSRAQENRETALHQLTQALAARDFELAQAQEALSRMERERETEREQGRLNEVEREKEREREREKERERELALKIGKDGHHGQRSEGGVLSISTGKSGSGSGAGGVARSGVGGVGSGVGGMMSSGVNRDYFKNVLVQYLTFPAASTERRSLLPVLGTLLALTSKEILDIQQANEREVSGAGIGGIFGFGGGGSTSVTGSTHGGSVGGVGSGVGGGSSWFVGGGTVKEMKRPAHLSLPSSSSHHSSFSYSPTSSSSTHLPLPSNSPSSPSASSHTLSSSSHSLLSHNPPSSHTQDKDGWKTYNTPPSPSSPPPSSEPSLSPSPNPLPNPSHSLAYIPPSPSFPSSHSPNSVSL